MRRHKIDNLEPVNIFLPNKLPYHILQTYCLLYCITENIQVTEGRKYLKKTVKEIQVSTKSDKNKGYITWRPLDVFFIILAQFFLEWEMFQTNIVDKIKTK